MPSFEELQALWQAQPPLPARAAEIESLRQALHEYSERVNRIYVIKAAAIPTLIGLVMATSHPSRGVLAVLAAVMGLVTVLVAIEWREQRAIARLDFTTVSVAFVRRTIERLTRQRDPFRKWFWVLFAALAAFENVWVLSIRQNWTSASRIGWHLAATAFPLAALEAGRRIRRWRFNRECRPLIERLTAIEKSLREEGE